MKASELVKQLQKVIKEHGDLEVTTGYSSTVTVDEVVVEYGWSDGINRINLQ